jgi:uncharacterized protein YbjT (DUF2867 family)
MMKSANDQTIAVLGATGRKGGQVVRGLMADGSHVLRGG